MANILFVYGSTSGNTEMVVDKVAAVLAAQGHLATTQRAEKTSVDDLNGYDLYVLACSTYGHGVLQEHFEPFAQALKGADLAGKRFAVIGLGDNLYDAEYNMESAHILEGIIHERGGELLYKSLRLNKSPVHYAEKIDRWTGELAEHI